MAQPKVGGLRTMGSREVAEAVVETDLSPQLNGRFKHVFQSRKSGFQVSLKRRRLHYMPDGTKEEEVPMSQEGNRMDSVRFVDHFYRTNDDDIAKAFESLPSEVFGVEGYCWRFEDKQNEMRAARAAEIRAALAADPDLAKAVKLTPSDRKDWDVKPKAADVVAEEMPEEELDRLTKPSK